MAGRQNGKNDYYNKLEPDAELKARLLNTCIENIDVINYFNNRTNDTKVSNDLVLRKRWESGENRNERKNVGTIKTIFAAACAVLMIVLIVKGVSSRVDNRKNAKITAKPTVKQEEESSIYSFNVDREFDHTYDIVGENEMIIIDDKDYYFKGFDSFLQMKNTLNEDGFKRLQSMCYDKSGKLIDGYEERSFNGVTIAANKFVDLDDVETYFFDKGSDSLKEKKKLFKVAFELDENIYLLVGEHDDTSKNLMLLTPYAHYEMEISDDYVVKGWSVYDQGNYFWYESAHLVESSDGERFVCEKNNSVIQLGQKVAVAGIFDDGRINLSDNLSFDELRKYICPELYDTEVEETVCTSKNNKDYEINGIYIIGNYAVKIEDGKLSYARTDSMDSIYNGVKFKYSGIRIGANDDFYRFSSFGDKIYYTENYTAKEFNLKTGKINNLFVADKPESEKDNYNFYVETSGQTRVIFRMDPVIDSGVENDDASSEALEYSYIFGVKSSKLLGKMPGHLIDDKDNYAVMKLGLSTQKSGVGYDLYDLNKGRVRKIRNLVSKGIYLSEHKSTLEKYYYFENDEDNKTWILKRCDYTGANEEVLYEFDDKTFSSFTDMDKLEVFDDLCRYEGVIYKYD